MQAQTPLAIPMTCKFSIGYLSKLLFAVIGMSTVLISHPHLAQAQTTPVSATANAQTAIADFDGTTARFGVPVAVPGVPSVPTVIPGVPGVGGIPGVPGVSVIPVVPGIVPVVPGIGAAVPGVSTTAVPNIGGVTPGGRGVSFPGVGGVSQPGARGVGIALPR